MRKSTVAALAYAALTLVITFPLVLHLNSAVPSDLGDPLLSTSILWWNAHVMPLTERWWNGFAFFPAPGMLAFSDHRLGFSVIATPLQWLGASPVTAYNVVFLATFPLCALGGHFLGFTLTKRDDAAAICGLAFGFNPFRVAHLSHLELLAAFGMPMGLAALHLYLRERRARWIVAFALALLAQALLSTYFLLFFGIVVALWMLWFVRDWRAVGAIAAASIASAGALLPLALGYNRIHHFYGFTRSLDEITAFSADLTSFLAAPRAVVLWGFTASLASGAFPAERQLFPGLTIITLATVGCVMLIRASRASAGDDVSWRRTSACLLIGSCAAAAVSVALTFSRITGAASWASVALLFLTLAIALHPATRRAWRRRSPLPFYLVAAGFLFLCSMGPVPTFFGEQILDKPPYAWLMALPVFAQSVRAPARAALPGILALAAAAALAFNQLQLAPSARRRLAAVVLAGILADSWARPLALFAAPRAWRPPPQYDFGAVIELPLSEFGDFAAMFRAMGHGHPLVNGHSGFLPTHYLALQLSLAEGAVRALDAFTGPKPLLVALDKVADPEGLWNERLSHSDRVTPLGDDGRWTFYGLTAPPAPSCVAPDLTIAAVHDGHAPIDVHVLTDRNASTVWTTNRPQLRDDMIEVDLGKTSRLCELRFSLGAKWDAFPRDLDVTTSADASTWTRQFNGSPAGLLVRGALAGPRDVWLTIPLDGAYARFVRLRLNAPHPTAPWSVAELRVTGS